MRRSALSGLLPKAFGLEVRASPGERRLHVSGAIDLSNLRTLEAAVDEAVEAGADATVLDLGDVEYVDSTGARQLLDLQERHDRLLVARPSAQVERTLRVMGVHDDLRWAEGE